MTIQADHRLGALTDKEKQTLRLIVRGHDAKSTGRTLGLSVHTINERLRDARRKMGVSSSREAARLLFQAEGAGEGASAPTPQCVGDSDLGDDRAAAPVDAPLAPGNGAGRRLRRSWIITGVLAMTLAFALLAAFAVPQPTAAPPPAETAMPADKAEQVEAARAWLALLDQGRWAESYQGTATAFRKLNTLQVWSDASERARTPRGAMISRTFLSVENLPAPPAGYDVVKFRTRFANGGETVETVTLDREEGDWRVVGVMIG